MTSFSHRLEQRLRYASWESEKNPIFFFAVVEHSKEAVHHDGRALADWLQNIAAKSTHAGRAWAGADSRRGGGGWSCGPGHGQTVGRSEALPQLDPRGELADNPEDERRHNHKRAYGHEGGLHPRAVPLPVHLVFDSPP